MTNLDSIFKSRDITLPTKVCLVKSMVFPVVMYGCESWTIKKAECWKNCCFWTVVLEKTLESPLDCKEIQPVHPKGDRSWMVIGRTNGHLRRRADSFKKTLMLGKIESMRRRGQQRRGWHHRLNGHEFEWTRGVGDGQGRLECCGPWVCKESDMTEPFNWTELIDYLPFCRFLFFVLFLLSSLPSSFLPSVLFLPSISFLPFPFPLFLSPLLFLLLK